MLVYLQKFVMYTLCKPLHVAALLRWEAGKALALICLRKLLHLTLWHLLDKRHIALVHLHGVDQKLLKRQSSQGHCVLSVALQTNRLGGGGHVLTSNRSIFAFSYFTNTSASSFVLLSTIAKRACTHCRFYRAFVAIL